MDAQTKNKNILVITGDYVPAKSFLKKYDEIHCFRRVAVALSQNHEIICKIIPEDILTARDYRFADHKGSIICDEIFDQEISNERRYNFLSRFGGNEYRRFFLRKVLLDEIANWLQSNVLISNMYECGLVNNNIYMVPARRANVRVYKKLYEFGHLNYSTPKDILIEIRTIQTFKAFYFLLKTIYIFLRTLLKANGGKVKGKDELLVGVNLYEGTELTARVQSADFFVDGKRITKDDCIFVIDQKVSDEYLQRCKSSNYKVIHLENEAYKYISRLDLLFKYFIILFRGTIYCVKSIITRPEYTRAISLQTRSEILWGIFYTNFNVKYFLRIMDAGELSSLVMMKKNNTSRVFIYMSVTQQIIKKKIDRMKTDCFGYTHMIFDKYVGDKISLQWFETLECAKGESIAIGPYLGPFIKDIDQKKRSQSKKIITFFDCSLGSPGVMNDSDLNAFLKGIIYCGETHPEWEIRYKSKKDVMSNKTSFDMEIQNLVDRLSEMKNFKNISPSEMQPHEAMGYSDIVVTFPISSVLFSAISGGKNTIVYDPNSRYQDDYLVEHKFEKLNATTCEELESKILYWLDEKKDIEVKNSIINFLNRSLSDYKCGSFVENFRDIVLRR